MQYNNKIKEVAVVALIAITCMIGYYYFSPFGFMPQSIGVLPENSPMTSNGYQIIVGTTYYQVTDLKKGEGHDVDENGGGGTITITNPITKDSHRVTGVRSSLMGDGFAVWVSYSRNPNAKKVVDGVTKGVISEFDLWAYDFSTKKEELLLDRISNNLNPNPPELALSGRKIVLASFANKLILVDYDTKIHEEVPMIPGYRISTNPIVYSGKYIVVAAWVNDTYNTNTLILYDTVLKSFKKIYESKYYSIGALLSDGKGTIYWGEYRPWTPDRFFKLNLN